MKGNSARADQRARRAAGLARTLVIYGLLLGGSLVFALPFLWMIGTSFKVDREMFGETISLLPATPVPAEASPYLDRTYYREPDQAAYDIVRPVILEAVARMALPLPEPTEGLEDAPAILAPGLFRKLWNTLPRATWKQPRPTLLPTVRDAITPAMVEEVTRRVYRHLSLGTVRVRSMELQEKELTTHTRISEFWDLEDSPAAKLVDREGGAKPRADIVYRWNGATSVSLTSTMDLPFRAERLSRIQLSITPDDSWHRMDFAVEKDGKLYEGLRPEYMGDFQPRVVTLQEFGPDDLPDANKIRLWIAYQEVDRGPRYLSDPGRVKVTITFSRSSQLGAWWAKCSRNYYRTLSYIPFWRFAGTSAFLVILNIIGNVFSCSLVAYAFARLRWPGREFCFGLMLATLMIPPQVIMIPYFLIIKWLGWYNTLKPLWVVAFFGNAFNIFLLRQFMKGIPRDLEDAAKIDGCNFLQIYWFVMMPLIRPTLACIAIFTFMAVWNDFMGPLIYLSDQRLYPLSLGLYALNVTEGGQYGMLMAGSMLMTLPVIIIFFFAQRYFIQGIALTGTKG